MAPIVLIEYTIAAVLGISLIGVLPLFKIKGSDRLPALCLTQAVIWLIIDATAYILDGNQTVPFIVSYVINFLAYILGPAIFIVFIRYREMYISERTEISPWLYRIPTIILSLTVAFIMEEFFRGAIVVYENGVLVADNGQPFLAEIGWLANFCYLPYPAFKKRKEIGFKAALLLGFVDLIILLSGLILFFTGFDFTVCFGSLELFLTVTFLQKHKFDEQRKQLEEARIAAEMANKAKTAFLFNMSHDIRTPMNAISGFTNMAIWHIDEKEKVKDYLGKVQQAEKILLSLIDNVLEVSRIESGTIILAEQPGDVYLSFVNIESTLRELAEAKNISISFEIDNIRDRYVYADFTRCMRVFVNVVSNAVKYTPDGGTVQVRCEQIGEVKDGYGTYQYTVTDNGIGMSEEFQKHIFEQFARENTTTVSGIEGTGLGMSVVKSFVDLMKGSITVNSRKDEGSTFTIVLPFKIQEGQDYTDPVTGNVVSAGIPRKEEEITYDFTGKKLLLVDDNNLNREIAIEILKAKGFDVEEAKEGSEAIGMITVNGPDYYDCILMDIQMPGISGYDATKAIRKMYPDSKLPIIALSANAFVEDKQKALEAGMNDHIAKPFELKELFSVLSKYVN